MENFIFLWSDWFFHSIPPGDVRKPLVFWIFRGLRKWKIGMKWVMYQLPIILFNQCDSAKITEITENLLTSYCKLFQCTVPELWATFYLQEDRL